MVDIRFRYKVALSCIVVMMVFVTLSGFSYAYFVAEVTGSSEPLTITTEGVDLTFTGESDIALDNASPISDTEGLKGTPYKFSLKNNNTYPVIAHIYLSVLKESNLDISNINVAYAQTESNLQAGNILTLQASEDIDSSLYSASYKLGDVNLSSTGLDGSTASNFKLLLWMKETAGEIQSCTIDDAGEKVCTTPLDPTMDKSFKAVITIKTEPNRDGAIQASDSSSIQDVNNGPQIFDNPSEISGNETEVVTPEVSTPENTSPQENEILNNDTPIVEEPSTEEIQQNGEGMEEPSIG